ncbi:hypothetical protein APHAL10511_001363 [Amanita phalloides]|nr:hypothetical protein APHAL10511_001363 [Amanita phalloides]
MPGPRKERKKGLKRGPYKKRDAKVPPPSSPSPAAASSAHNLYIPEPPALYPPCLFAQFQPPPIQSPHTGHEPLATAYPIHPPYYPAAFLAQFSPSIFPQYPIPPPDPQLLSQNVHYSIHSTNSCTKQPGQPGRSDVSHGHCPL